MKVYEQIVKQPELRHDPATREMFRAAVRIARGIRRNKMERKAA